MGLGNPNLYGTPEDRRPEPVVDGSRFLMGRSDTRVVPTGLPPADAQTAGEIIGLNGIIASWWMPGGSAVVGGARGGQGRSYQPARGRRCGGSALVGGIGHAMRKHLTGRGPTSLRTLDPGGTLDKWAGHVVKTATSGSGTPRAVQGGEVLEVMAPMAREAGGVLNIGVRMFCGTGEEVWKLTTILTRQ